MIQETAERNAADVRISEWTDRKNEHPGGYAIHVIRARGNWSYPLHMHRGFCEIVYATRGEFSHRINGEVWIQRAGDMALIRESDAHEIWGSHFTYSNLMFPPEWISRLEAYLRLPGLAEILLEGESAPRGIVPPDERADCEAALERLQARALSAEGRQGMAEFVLRAIPRWIARPTDAGSGVPSGAPAWLQDALSEMIRHPGSVSKVPDLVRICGRSPEHVSRTVSRYLGMSPSQYLVYHRIARAANLLATTNLPIREICFLAGFENESYFFRQFRNLKHLTPRAYRRKFGPRAAT